MCANTNTISCSTWRQKHSCYQHSATVVTPQLLSIVVNRMRPSESVVNSHRRLRWQRLWHDESNERRAI